MQAGKGEGKKEICGQGWGKGGGMGSVPVSEGFAVASCRRMLTAAVEARVRAASCPNPKKL